MHPAVRARLSNNFFDRIIPLTKWIIFGNASFLMSEVFIHILGISDNTNYLLVSTLYSLAMILSLMGLAGIIMSAYAKYLVSDDRKKQDEYYYRFAKTWIWISEHSVLLCVSSLFLAIIGLTIRVLTTIDKIGMDIC